jgi:hypothetical protein
MICVIHKKIPKPGSFSLFFSSFLRTKEKKFTMADIRLKFAGGIGLLTIMLTGCFDYNQFDHVTVDPFSASFALPVVNSTITFREIMEKSGTDGIAEVQPGSNLYDLVYRDTTEAAVADLQMPLVSKDFNDNFQLDPGEVPGSVTPGTLLGPFTKTFDQSYSNFNGAELKEADLSGGSLEIDLTNQFDHQVSGHLDLTSLSDASGHPIVLNFNLPGQGSQYTTTVNLNGMVLDLFESPDTYNHFGYSLTATLYTSSDPSPAGSVTIRLSLRDPAYRKITGKINQTFVLEPQTYDIGIFASTVLAEQHLADPRFSIRVMNSFGMPSQVTCSNLEVRNNTGDILQVANEGTLGSGDLSIGTPNDLKYATADKSSDTTRLELNKDNSNLENVFDIAPSSLQLSASLQIGDNSNNHDYFIRNDSKFRIMSEIRIPLSGWVVTNEINDTLQNVDWPDLQKDLNISDDGKAAIRIKLKCTNEIPINTDFQVNFCDENGNFITGLFAPDAPPVVQSAPLNAAGESSGSSVVISEVTVDQAKYNQIATSKNMVLIFRFSTGGSANHQTVRILSTNSISLAVSVEASGNVKM